MIRTVLFDMGNTLIEGTRAIDEACALVGKERPRVARVLQRAAEYFHLKREQALRELTQNTFREALMLSVMTEEFGQLDESEGGVLSIFQGTTSGDLHDLVGAVFEKTIENVSLVPGAKGTLGVLRDEGYDLAVVSNVSFGGWRYVQLLDRLGIGSLFHTFIYSSDLGYRKPHPLPFQKALEALCVPAHKAIHVGDLYYADVMGAQPLGIAAVLLDRENAYGRRDAILPDWVICDIQGVLSIVHTA